MGMFDDDLPESTAPVDTTEITTTILYFSKEELAEFRKLVKRGMKQMHPDNFLEKATIPDILLTVLREKYADV